MPLVSTGSGFDLELGGALILRHRPEAPCLFAGAGRARMDMYRGNFDIEDRVSERTPLRHADIRTVGGAQEIAFASAPGLEPRVVLSVEALDRDAILRFTFAAPDINRLWLRVAAEPGEHVWGGGEQMSYFDMRG